VGVLVGAFTHRACDEIRPPVTVHPPDGLFPRNLVLPSLARWQTEWVGTVNRARVRQSRPPCWRVGRRGAVAYTTSVGTDAFAGTPSRVASRQRAAAYVDLLDVVEYFGTW